MGTELSPLVAALLSAITAWTGVWQHVSDLAIEQLLNRSEPPARIAAPEITTGAVRLVGSDAQPLLSIDAVTARGVTHGQAWEWRLGEVVLGLVPQDATRIIVDLPSPQSFHGRGPFGTTALTLWARNLGATIRLTEAGRIQSVVLHGEGLTVAAPNLEIEMARLDLSLLERSDGTMTLEASIADLLMPERYRLPPPMGATVDRVRLSARGTGLMPAVPESAEAWQSVKGLIGISDLSARWGSFAIALEGRVGLDKFLRPTGRFTINATGLTTALAAAHGAGVLNTDAHRRTQESLAGIGELRGTESADDLRLSFAMSGGNLNWAGFPIARLPKFGIVTPVSDCLHEVEESTKSLSGVPC